MIILNLLIVELNLKKGMLVAFLFVFLTCTPSFSDGLAASGTQFSSALLLNTPLTQNQNSLSNQTSQIRITRFSFSSLALSTLTGQNIQSTPLGSKPTLLTNSTNDKPKLIGKPYVYPTPFYLYEGATIGYELRENMAIELRVYDMHGYQIYKDAIPAGIFGKTTTGYNNKLRLSSFEIGSSLSAGIYFFVLINEGDVIGKGRFAVKP